MTAADYLSLFIVTSDFVKQFQPGAVVLKQNFSKVVFKAMVTQSLLDKRRNCLVVPNLFFFKALVICIEIKVCFLYHFVRYFYPDVEVCVKSKNFLEKAEK